MCVCVSSFIVSWSFTTLNHLCFLFACFLIDSIKFSKFLVEKLVLQLSVQFCLFYSTISICWIRAHASFILSIQIERQFVSFVFRFRNRRNALNSTSYVQLTGLYLFNLFCGFHVFVLVCTCYCLNVVVSITSLCISEASKKKTQIILWAFPPNSHEQEELSTIMKSNQAYSYYQGIICFLFFFFVSTQKKEARRT